jgi:predicted ester cyclase
MRWLAIMLRTAFPELYFTIEDLVAEGDKVTARFTMSATHRDELWGIVPTGKQLTITVMEIYHILEGKIEEQWVILDALGMMQQLGAILEPG